MAKLIIKLINSVAEVINHDRMWRAAHVAFSGLQRKERAAHLPGSGSSEQISTAGKEASAPEHEIFHEWSAHHRDPGRREHRDP